MSHYTHVGEAPEVLMRPAIVQTRTIPTRSLSDEDRKKLDDSVKTVDRINLAIGAVNFAFAALALYGLYRVVKNT